MLQTSRAFLIANVCLPSVLLIPNEIELLPRMSVAAGDRLGPYEILSRIGDGGMGEVWRAKDTRLNRTVAIKLLGGEQTNQPDFHARFEREAKAISSFNHPHICTVHDFGTANGQQFLVLEYLDGETLAARLRRGPMRMEEFLRCAMDVLAALSQAHRQGLVHRDLKPANIMLTKSGAKVLDFGVARAVGFARSGRRNTHKSPHQRRHHYGDVPVHVAGAVAGTRGGFALRHFLFRRRAVRDGVGATRIRGREYCERHRSRIWNANPRLCPSCNRIYRGGWTGLWRPASRRILRTAGNRRMM